MHPNPEFRKTGKNKNIEFARARSFGVLAVNAEQGPLVSHIPFQLSKDGTYLEGHLVRSNPIVRLLKSPLNVVVAVSGGDAYISPDWYGVDNQVPTWNYIAVHIRGQLKRLNDNELRGILERLSDDMESRLVPKTPWNISKVDDEIFSKMSRQIVPVGLQVTSIDSTWKLSQNKPEEARKGVITGLNSTGFGNDVKEIAEAMTEQFRS